MRIKEIRESKGMTQRQAAIALGLSPMRYGRYENEKRKPEPEMLISIAEFFGVTVDELIGNDYEDTKKEPANPGGLDSQLAEMLVSLSPGQVQRVRDFVSGLIASDTE